MKPTIRKLVGEMQRQVFSHPEPEHVSLKGLTPPAIERLDEIHCPVLILSGALDVPEFVRLSELLSESVPRAKRTVIPEAAHMVSMEAPEKFYRCVTEFILFREQDE